MIFTTSWDDGYALDLPLAEMLARHGAKGTFYVCPQPQHGQRMLTEAEIRTVSEQFEIGAHTLTHPRLTSIRPDKARAEIRDSKTWIEGITGKECAMFCYPKGDESPAIQAMVKDAGFRGARSTEFLQFDITDPFMMPTTMHVYPMPIRRKYHRWQHVVDPLGPLRVRWTRLRELHIPLASMRGWLPLTKAVFLRALETGAPVFHLWGHSEEVKRLGLWEDLEEFLRFASRHTLEHKTNGEVIASLPR